MSNIIDVKSSKGSVLLGLIRKTYPNYHPIVAIVDIAHNPEASLELQYNCHKTVAKYIEPELKSIEVKGDFVDRKTVSVSLFDESEVEDVVFNELANYSNETV